MSLGNVAICYFAEMEQSSSKTPETIEVFVERLITGNPYQDLMHKKEIQGIQYWYHGKWSLRERKAVALAVTKDISEEANEKLSVFQGEHHGTDRRKWVIAICAANVPVEKIHETHTDNSVGEGKRYTIYAFTQLTQENPVELTLKNEELYRQWKLYSAGNWPVQNGRTITADERMVAFTKLANAIEKDAGCKPIPKPVANE